MFQTHRNASILRNSLNIFSSERINMDRITLVLLLVFCEIFYRRIGMVTANGNTIIKSGPFLQLEKPVVKRLIISKPHLPHYLSCIATIEESFYYQNETNYFYTWFRNDIELDNSWEQRSGFIVFRNGTLRLPNGEKANGIYRCKINANKIAVLSESITVIFPVLKRLQISPNITAVSNFSLTLNCPVISIPPANVSWYFGDQIISKAKNPNSYVLLTNGSIVLRWVTPKDEGKYKCLAKNQFASKKIRQYSLTVKVKAPNDDLLLAHSYSKATRLIPNLQNKVQYVLRGENLTLYCYSFSDTTNIDWYFQRFSNDEPVKISNHTEEIYNIYNAEIDNDQGIYTCKTTSDQQSFHVTVMIPPDIPEQLPSYETLISASLVFKCKSFGNPMPTISWYHNGIHINSSYSRYINGNELTLHSFDPDEDGIYQCFARNIAGEVYSAAEVRFRDKAEGIPKKNPLKNIRCYPHSFNTINITFESDTTESLFIVHIVQENPHRWTSPFAPMKLNQTAFVVISSQLPIYRPFELITRVLFPTSEIRQKNMPQQQTIQSSIRSVPITCCTQGLLLHIVQLGLNRTFLTWSQPELMGKKYFVLQFSINHTQPHPKKLLESKLHGTTQHVQLHSMDIQKKLENIVAFSEEITSGILSRIIGEKVSDDIFSMALPANVTGIVLQNFNRIQIRVLIITSENENLIQDFSYVQWKVIHNGTTELINTPFHLSTIESRTLGIYFQDIFNESCVEACLWQIKFPYFNKEQPKCQHKPIINSYVTLSGLKPMEPYRLNFFSCESHAFYGQLDVKTLPDPPGTISNQRILRSTGLKLTWDPPLKPNGKVYHYNIMWTLGNTTHEANVLECNPCSFKFPNNVLETSKINISVRVVGETGVGAPIYLDLRKISHQSLEIERSSAYSVYTGILIGLLLSLLCILCFITFFLLHKRRLKHSNQLRSQSELNFSNLSNIGPQRTPIQHENVSIQHDFFEMQTLIPKPKRSESLTQEFNLSDDRQTSSANDNDPPPIRHETQSQQTILNRNEKEIRQIESNWNVHQSRLNRNTTIGMNGVQNEIDILLPSGTLSLVYAAFNHPNDNKANEFVKSEAINQAIDYGNTKLIPNRLNRNKSNDIVCLLTEEDTAAARRTPNSLQFNTKILNTISTSITPDEKESNFLTRYEQKNGIPSATRKSQHNNNNISPLMKNSFKNCGNKLKRKTNNGKIPNEKREPTKESSLFSLLSPVKTASPPGGIAENTNWTNTMRSQVCVRPSLGPNG